MNIQKVINATTTFYQRLHLKKLGCKFGRHSRFCGDISIHVKPSGKLIIGDNIIITGGYFINAFGCKRGSCIRVDKDATIIIGNNCGFSDVSIWSRKQINIGNNVIIGANTIINDSNSHCLNYLDRRREYKTKDKSTLPIKHLPVIIDDDVFIGANCIINKGVHIGARSVIAAGSVVVRDVPADEIWGGNPACFIRKSIKQ